MSNNENNENNKRIIKNTLFLYFRMILILGITLYTSRLILAELGVEDFGTYNVVAGVVTMFSFMTGAMSAATQRFLSYEHGNADTTKIQAVFKMSINIHALIFILVIIIAETVGLWFLNNKLNIAPDRIYAANWTYQCSIIAFGFSIMTIPYIASIVSNEKMDAFAYISILEVILKLAIVFILGFHLGDNLIVYSILVSCTSAFIWFLYYAYCRLKLTDMKYSFFWENSLFKELIGFTGWNLIGSLAFVGMNQGINILLNIFFGPAINASRAISGQVTMAVQRFSSNLQMSMNPLITKSYASGKHEYMHLLVFKGSKYSFFLLLFLTLPLLIKIELVLTWWLGSLPEKLVVFSQLSLVDSLIVSLSGTLITAASANGKIKNYQIVAGGLLILNVPISYLFFIFGAAPEISLLVMISISITALFTRLFFLKGMINLSIKEYFKLVLIKVILVSLVCIPIMFYITSFFGDTFFDFIIQCVLSSLLVSMTIWFFGLDLNERKFVLTKTHIFYKKLRKIKT